MNYLNEADKSIIATLAIYVLMGELEEKKIVTGEMWKKHYEGLTEIEKQVVSFFEIQKQIILKEITKKIES